jgi:L-rhamnose isomerase/sugar isomerase
MSTRRDLDSITPLYSAARTQLDSRGIDLESVRAKLNTQAIEVPSWGFSRGGTRFGRYVDGSEARNVREKIEDAGLVFALTGVTPAVSLHFPWDGSREDEYKRIPGYLKEAGIGVGAINSNTFTPRAEPLDHRLRYGSLTNPDPAVRLASVEHNLDCIRIMRLVGSKTLKVWLPDGTNYPGELSFCDQSDYLEECLEEIYSQLRDDEVLLIEYKLFEPAFYSTAVADWGRALTLAQRLGDRAKVLIDLGHHAHGVNVEQIVANLARLGRLGGFDFNDRKSADDDLAVSSIDSYQIFLIYNALVEGELRGHLDLSRLSFLIDQSSHRKNPIEEVIESAAALQRAYAQALVVDRKRLADAQRKHDLVAADRILKQAFFEVPVHAVIQMNRHERGLPLDPIDAFREGGYEAERRSRRAADRPAVGESLF